MRSWGRRGAGGLVAAAVVTAAAGCGGPAGGVQDGAVPAASGGHGTPTGRMAPSPRPRAAKRGLAGAVVVLDPGHNGGNGRHPSLIDRKVATPLGPRPCDTAGAKTDGGYPEHVFTWEIVQRLAARLRAAGARVVLTRRADDGVGPCTVDRARIGNQAGGAAGAASRVAALSLHADGGPAGGYGFHVIEPGPAGSDDAIVAISRRLGTDVRDAFRAGTGEPYATYLGHGGVTVRTDLVGLDLSTIPKVFVECGNMHNSGDARRLADPAWQDRAADALERGLAAFLSGT